MLSKLCDLWLSFCLRFSMASLSDRSNSFCIQLLVMSASFLCSSCQSINTSMNQYIDESINQSINQIFNLHKMLFYFRKTAVHQDLLNTDSKALMNSLLPQICCNIFTATSLPRQSWKMTARMASSPSSSSSAATFNF